MRKLKFREEMIVWVTQAAGEGLREVKGKGACIYKHTHTYTSMYIYVCVYLWYWGLNSGPTP
jgi:hypothetical protein